MFSLLSLDVLSSPAVGFNETQTITSSAGGAVSLNTVGTQTFSSPAWDNLTSITLSSTVHIAGPGFDNITFSVVALPPALMLFALGLACLIGLRPARPGWSPRRLRPVSRPM